ncbi:MAG: 5'/3'-nucleotidase SurE [Bacteroidales bacterium]|nr:5'/3'-nucleotidase SurE [Bacteroidales bacterium]
MSPLFLITNDDGYGAKGIQTLIRVARELGDIVVMAPERNASALSHSLTSSRPLRVHTISEIEGSKVYLCDGTPVDCVKLCAENFCPRRPDLVLSGINHGSNSSINVLYSATMGAVLEAAVSGLPAIGFSLLDFSPDADFELSVPFVRSIIKKALENELPSKYALNVNIPVPADGKIKGVRVCRQSQARWVDSYERRVDPHGRPYYWLTGNFECDDISEDTDQWALQNGYVSIVPTTTDFTAMNLIEKIRKDYE